MRTRTRGQSGESLVEVLIATVILAMVGIGAFAGLATSITVSSSKRTNASSEAALRSAAERLQDPDVAYVDCATGSTYDGALTAAPAGFSYSAVVKYWVPPSSSPSATVPRLDPVFAGSCGSDGGLQSITLTLVGLNGEQRSLDVVKRRR
jgi:Tfp pilus assembly protein PilV